jgi:hypothetical protein
MSASTVLLGLMLVGVIIVIGLIAAEFRSRSRAAAIPAADKTTFDADPYAIPDPASLTDVKIIPRRSLSVRLRHLRTIAKTAIAQHPLKAYGWAETIFWLLFSAAFIDYLFDANGFVGLVVWVLTIGFHEAGHLICNPFGEFIMFTGGSIWQVLTWVLFTAGMVLFYRRISGALICWSVVGFSLINLSRYIDDARARKMPLLFGLDSTHHDWWWLLSHTNLLAYDHVFAFITVMIGILVMLSAILMGIGSAWLFPRVIMNQKRRFAGNIRQAITTRWVQLAAVGRIDEA